MDAKDVLSFLYEKNVDYGKIAKNVAKGATIAAICGGIISLTNSFFPKDTEQSDEDNIFKTYPYIKQYSLYYKCLKQLWKYNVISVEFMNEINVLLYVANRALYLRDHGNYKLQEIDQLLKNFNYSINQLKQIMNKHTNVIDVLENKFYNMRDNDEEINEDDPLWYYYRNWMIYHKPNLPEDEFYNILDKLEDGLPIVSKSLHDKWLRESLN